MKDRALKFVVQKKVAPSASRVTEQPAEYPLVFGVAESLSVREAEPGTETRPGQLGLK